MRVEISNIPEIVLIRNPPRVHHELPVFLLAYSTYHRLPHLPRTGLPKTPVTTFLLGAMEATLDAMGMLTGSNEQLGQLNDVLSKQVGYSGSSSLSRFYFTITSVFEMHTRPYLPLTW